MYYSSLWLDPAECPTVCLINFKVLMREKQRLDVIRWHKFKLLCLQKHFLLINKYMFQNCLPETTEGDTPPPNPHPLLSSHPPSFPPCLWNHTHTHTQLHTSQDPHTVPEHSTPRSDHPRWDPVRARDGQSGRNPLLSTAAQLIGVSSSSSPHQHLIIIIITVCLSQLDHEPVLFWLLGRGNRAPRSGRGGTY